MNFTCGGLFGYCSSNCMTSLNVPSSNGVSAGPMMTAFLMTKRGQKAVGVWLSRGASREDYSPGHDVVGDWGGRDAGRRISLHALEVTHQTATSCGRHYDKSGGSRDRCKQAWCQVILLKRAELDKQSLTSGRPQVVSTVGALYLGVCLIKQKTAITNVR
jgi:hypothetical protein